MVGSSYSLFVWRELDHLGKIRHDDEVSLSLPYPDPSSLLMSFVIFFFVVCHSSSLNFLIQGIDFLHNNTCFEWAIAAAWHV